MGTPPPTKISPAAQRCAAGYIFNYSLCTYDNVDISHTPPL